MSLDPKYLIDRRMEDELTMDEMIAIKAATDKVLLAVEDLRGELMSAARMGIIIQLTVNNKAELWENGKAMPMPIIEVYLSHRDLPPVDFTPVTKQSFDGGKGKPYIIDEIGLYPQTESEFKRWGRVLTAKNEPEDEHPNNKDGH